MSVTNVNASLPAQGSDTAKEKEKKHTTTLGKDEFMTLFITQLQHQDPLAPLESYEMAAQLAQFSSVETMMNVDNKLEQLLSFQSSQNNLQIVSLLDKDVLAAGNKLAVNNGETGATEFGLTTDVASCVIEIYDDSDSLVRSLDMGSMKANTYELAWDGKDTSGRQVPDGAYSYVVKGLDANGDYSPVDYRTAGRVTGLSFESGQASLTLDKYIVINVKDVAKVVESKNPDTAAPAPADDTTSADAAPAETATENI